MAKEKKKSDGSEPIANKNHELFCRLFAGNRSGRAFNNATESWMVSSGSAEEVEKNLEAMVMLAAKAAEAWKKDKEAHSKYKKDFQKLEERNKSLRKSAATLGQRLFRKVEINKRIDHLLDQYLEPGAMDREMAKVIAQDKDMMSKVSAYREVAKVRGRINEKLSGEFVVKWEEPDAAPKSVKKKITERVATASVEFLK